MSALLIAVPAVPLLAAPLILLIARRLPWQGGELLVAVTAFCLVALVIDGEPRTVQAVWFESGAFQLTVGLELNGLTRFVALVVAGVSLFVALYSLGYMADESGQPRFFAELALFVGAMLTLVLASSLVLLFMAWEAVGIASYLLIGFRYQQEDAGAAAAKALITTRLGDLGFLLAWLLVLSILGTTEISALLSAIGDRAISPPLLTVIAGLLFLAAMGKSAQLPLTMWLPDAMAAPTPVSALIHSATMVAAGVYLLLRLYPLFAAAPGALQAVFWVGAGTALFSAVAATGAMDLKRVLAWSTSSHLGAMMMAIGLGGPLAAALLFVMHASFKAALFLAAGVVDKHAGTRDLRQLGGLGYVLPITALAFSLGALSLAGLQSFLGPSSEDAVIATALSSAPAAAFLVLGLIFLGGLYIARAGIAVFAGSRPVSRQRPVETSFPMLIGMMALAVAAALGSLIVAAVPEMLPFRAQPEAPWFWRVVAILAGAAGLAVGGWYARQYHAASPLGRLPGAIERSLAAATEFLPVIVSVIVHGVERIERRLDAVAGEALGIGRICIIVQRIEHWFDAVARRVAAGVWFLASGSDRLEQRDFGGGGDRLAQAFQSSGETLRALESGRIYLYTLGLFVWSLGVLIAGGLVFVL